MSRLLTSAVLACLLAGGPVSAQTAQDVSAAPAASAAPQSSVKLVGVVMALPAGTPWLQLKVGTLLCLGQGVTRTATGGRQPQELSAYSASFKEELQRAGYRAVTPQDNLFDPEAVSADYEVAGVITDAHFEGCIKPRRFWH